MANPQGINKIIYKKALPILFLMVLLLSLYLETELTWTTLFFSISKALISSIVFWFFLLVLGESIIKSILWSLTDQNHLREEGGLIYHFLEAQIDEKKEGGLDNAENDEKSAESKDSTK